MSISTIGNTYTYVYDAQTKKLSTTDGTQNDFTKYFNGCTNDNGFPYPDAVYNRVLKRYEDWLYQPITDEKDSRELLQGKIEEMQENVEAGDVNQEPVFQIGASEFTEKEWDTFLKNFDDSQEELWEEMKLAHERALEEVQIKEEIRAKQLEAVQKEEQIQEEQLEKLQEDAEIQKEDLKELQEQERVQNEVYDEKEIKTKTLIEKSEAELLTSEYVSCTYADQNFDQDSEPKDWHYITWFTEEGMFCKDVNGHVGNDWAFYWENEEQYQKVMEFINQFPDDYNMRFAANQTFWKDFLNDEIDMEGFMDFLSTTNNGVPNYGIGDAENMHIDREKAQWAKYLNQPGLFRPLTRVDEMGFPYPDKEYIDEKTGFRWNVNGDGEPYMLGNWKEDFYRHSEKTGADPNKKFAELTGMLQYLQDGSYAYIGSNAISIKSVDGEKLVVSKKDMTYDMLMYMFDNLPETDNYLDLSYWEEHMAAAKEAVPAETVVRFTVPDIRYFIG